LSLAGNIQSFHRLPIRLHCGALLTMIKLRRFDNDNQIRRLYDAPNP
jgi:hypothetical protein